jgi:hypothetical protein
VRRQVDLGVQICLDARGVGTHGIEGRSTRPEGPLDLAQALSQDGAPRSDSRALAPTQCRDWAQIHVRTEHRNADARLAGPLIAQCDPSLSRWNLERLHGDESA